MQTSTNSTTNTTLNQLVYEPVPPINPLNPEGQSGINPINASGNLAEQAGPGLSTRQAQPIYSLFEKYKSDAHRLVREGKITEASEIYLSLVENRELKLEKRLNYAKKLVEINAQTLKTAKAKEYTAKAADLLIEIVKDDRVHGPSRLKAFRILTETKDLEEKALEVFETLFKSPVLSDWIPNAARDCVVPILLSRIKDLTALSFNRIEAAEKLSTLVGEDRQGEIWSALINERLNYIHPNYGMKVAEKLGKIQGYEAVAAGYLLYLGRHKHSYIFWNIEALKKLSKIPGYEASARECRFLLYKTIKDNDNDYDNTVYFKQWEDAEALAAIPGQEANAATVLLNITKGPLSRMLCFHHTGERLSKIPGQEAKSKEAWDHIANYKHSHPSMVNSIILGTTALIELFGGDKERADAAEILTKLARDETESLEHRILAVDNLKKIPGQEAEAEKWRIKLNTTQETTKNTITTAKNLLQVPEEKEKAANDLLKIAKSLLAVFSDRMLAAEILSEVPEHHPKAIEAWTSIRDCGKYVLYQRILACGGLSKIPGQADNARKLVDAYMIQISDSDKYFQV